MVDMNLVMTGSRQFSKIQGTGGENSFSKEQLARLLQTAEAGICELIELQKEVLAEAGLRIRK